MAATPTASFSGTSSAVTDWLPPAVVALSVVKPARRWNIVDRKFQPMIAVVSSAWRCRKRLPDLATKCRSVKVCPSDRARTRRFSRALVPTGLLSLVVVLAVVAGAPPWLLLAAVILPAVGAALAATAVPGLVDQFLADQPASG